MTIIFSDVHNLNISTADDFYACLICCSSVTVHGLSVYVYGTTSFNMLCNRHFLLHSLSVVLPLQISCCPSYFLYKFCILFSHLNIFFSSYSFPFTMFYRNFSTLIFLHFSTSSFCPPTPIPLICFHPNLLPTFSLSSPVWSSPPSSSPPRLYRLRASLTNEGATPQVRLMPESRGKSGIS